MPFSTRSIIQSALPLVLLGLSHVAGAYDNSRNDNLAVYWGQNSYGAGHTDTANFQKTLSTYCADDSIDAFPIAFLNVFYSTGGLPSINLANTCNPTDQPVFPGSQLPNCGFLAADIKACQAKGKIVTISLGGASASGGFASDQAASDFADLVWNLFLGGSSSTRPFGDAKLDGVDLDIEGGSPSGYAAFVNRIRSKTDKKYYVTAAPQCVYPDASLGSALNAASFDAVYVQFYNNPCGVINYGQVQNWNFGVWDYWARNISPNRNVKVYIGAPASSTAGGGYVPLATLQNIAQTTRKSFPSFGGVMLWDASQAWANGRFDAGVKAFLKDGNGPFVFPACSAPEWTASGTYMAGATVSYQGYIWTAKWWASGAPSSDVNSSWAATSACSGSGGSTISTPTPTSTTPSTTPSSTKPTTTPTQPTSTTPTSTTKPTTTPSATPTNGSGCSGLSAWSSSVAYTTGQRVTYNGHSWTAKWWTQAEVPTGADGNAWTDGGVCLMSRFFKF